MNMITGIDEKATLPPGIITSSEPVTYTIHTELSDPEWDNFLLNLPGGNHLQTSLWGQGKRMLGWEATRIIARQQAQILAGAQLLTRKIIPGITISYLTRGPVFIPGSEYLASRLIEQILSLSKERKFAYLAVQPPAQSDFVITELEYQGFRKSTLELAPTATLLVDLRSSPEELLGRLKRQTKQNVRRSENAGIITRPGNAADIGTFIGLHQKTSQRQNFLSYSDAYFEHIWSLFSPGGHVCILLAEYNQEAISGLLLIAYGDTVAAKLIGWSGAYPDLRPNDALFWGAINWSKSNGYSWFDFEGINRQGALAWLQNGELPEQYRHTPDFLKYGYGGQVAILPEAYEISFNSLISLAMKNMKLHVNDQSWSSKFIDRIRKR